MMHTSRLSWSSSMAEPRHWKGRESDCMGLTAKHFQGFYHVTEHVTIFIRHFHSMFQFVTLFNFLMALLLPFLSYLFILFYFSRDSIRSVIRSRFFRRRHSRNLCRIKQRDPKVIIYYALLRGAVFHNKNKLAEH